MSKTNSIIFDRGLVRRQVLDNLRELSYDPTLPKKGNSIFHQHPNKLSNLRKQGLFNRR